MYVGNKYTYIFSARHDYMITFRNNGGGFKFRYYVWSV